MKLITTTATAVEKLKTHAKSVARLNKLPHTEALEHVARESGYESWYHVQWCQSQSASQHSSVQSAVETDARAKLDAQLNSYMDYLKQHGGVPVGQLAVKGDDFHGVEIEGSYFIGVVGGDGPYIHRLTALSRGHSTGWVQLGVSGIYFTDPSMNRKAPPKEWSVCKYSGNEPRININDLSPAGRHALAYEFGLKMVYPFEKTAEEYPSEKMWPPSKSLCLWAQKHPRKIRKCGPANSYLGSWVDAAIKGEYTFNADYFFVA